MRLTNFKKPILIALIILPIIGGSLWFITSGNYEKQYIIKEIYENRSEIVFKTSSIEVDNILLPYVKEFIDDAIRYNINIDSISRGIMGIYYDYTSAGLVGAVFFKTTTDDYVLVSPLLGNFINKLRVVVFHELGHYYLKRKHCHQFCAEIMSRAQNGFSIYNNWENQKKVMFENLQHKKIIK